MSEGMSRPASDGDHEGWKAYWVGQGMPWRTEPEIDAERQQYLTERRAITPDIAQGAYPFKDIKLNRADVEWLLATHESGGMRGPINWEDTKQRHRVGLDLRAANLRGVDLDYLPLARLHAGLGKLERTGIDTLRRRAAGVNMEKASLSSAQLEGAILTWGHLEGANLYGAHLQQAELDFAHFEAANLFGASLAGASLCSAYFDVASYLKEVRLGDRPNGGAILAGVRWGSAELATIDWSLLRMLGDERRARRPRSSEGATKTPSERLEEYREALRANRQLALALRAQGLNEEADDYSYRALALRRVVARRRRHYVRYIGSLFLDVLTGYGYRLERILITYVITLSIFALAYYIIGLPNEHAATLLQHVADAYQVSLTAIHGRTFFEQFGIGSTLAWVAAAESVCGLVIEAVFTSMLVQRFFAR